MKAPNFVCSTRWQGDRDSRDPALTEHYEANLVGLIKSLRLRYKAPNAPFVAASLGQSTLDPSCVGNCGGGILKAEENIADATKYPEFKGNYASVDSHKFTQPGGSSGSHYGHNAKTYMDVGQAMGIETIAERVESKQVIEKLSELGVRFAQGFYIARPTSVQTFEPWSDESTSTRMA